MPCSSPQASVPSSDPQVQPTWQAGLHAAAHTTAFPDTAAPDSHLLPFPLRTEPSHHPRRRAACSWHRAGPAMDRGTPHLTTPGCQLPAGEQRSHSGHPARERARASQQPHFAEFTISVSVSWAPSPQPPSCCRGAGLPTRHPWDSSMTNQWLLHWSLKLLGVQWRILVISGVRRLRQGDLWSCSKQLNSVSKKPKSSSLKQS